jgi:hypothetical protein
VSAVLAVDPGQSGGVCILTKDREVKLLQPMPIVGTEIDSHGLSDLFREMAFYHNARIAIIEKSQCRPGQSAQSGLKTGRNYGILEGILATLKLPYKEIRPQEWTKVLTAAKKPEGATNAQLYKLSKERNVREAIKLYPHVNLLATGRSKVPHLGMVDALLIADYGLRFL